MVRISKYEFERSIKKIPIDEIREKLSKWNDLEGFYLHNIFFKTPQQVLISRLFGVFTQAPASTQELIFNEIQHKIKKLDNKAIVKFNQIVFNEKETLDQIMESLKMAPTITKLWNQRQFLGFTCLLDLNALYLPKYWIIRLFHKLFPEILISEWNKIKDQDSMIRRMKYEFGIPQIVKDLNRLFLILDEDEIDFIRSIHAFDYILDHSLKISNKQIKASPNETPLVIETFLLSMQNFFKYKTDETPINLMKKITEIELKLKNFPFLVNPWFDLI